MSQDNKPLKTMMEIEADVVQNAIKWSNTNYELGEEENDITYQAHYQSCINLHNAIDEYNSSIESQSH